MVAAKQKEIDDINAEKKEWEDMITCASFECLCQPTRSAS